MTYNKRALKRRAHERVSRSRVRQYAVHCEGNQCCHYFLKTIKQTRSFLTVENRTKNTSIEKEINAYGINQKPFLNNFCQERKGNLFAWKFGKYLSKLREIWHVNERKRQRRRTYGEKRFINTRFYFTYAKWTTKSAKYTASGRAIRQSTRAATCFASTTLGCSQNIICKL